MNGYAVLGRQLQASGLVSDPWLDGAPRFATQPVLLSAARHRAVGEAATGIVRVHDELARLVAATPALADCVLLRQGRLSVLPISAAEWEAVLNLSV